MHGQTDAQKGVVTWQWVGEAIWGGGGGLVVGAHKEQEVGCTQESYEYC